MTANPNPDQPPAVWPEHLTSAFWTAVNAPTYDESAAATLALVRLLAETVAEGEATQWPGPLANLIDPTRADPSAVSVVPPATNQTAPVDRAAVLREAADLAESLRQFEPATGARKSAQVSENVGILRVADELRRRATCPWCESGTEHDVHCSTPETHNWGCGCPSDVAAAIASCPGYEMAPSPCRCPCEGCKHHCGAHDPQPAVGPRVAAEAPHTATPAAPAVVAQPGKENATEDPPVVAYRSDGGRLLNCLRHVPPPAARHADFHPVTSEDLPDGGICTYPNCGVDVLITTAPAISSRPSTEQGA